MRGYQPRPASTDAALHLNQQVVLYPRSLAQSDYTEAIRNLEGTIWVEQVRTLSY